MPRSAIEELDRWIRKMMPPGWTIKCLFKLHGEHHQLTGYQLKIGFDVFTLDIKGRGELPPGWTSTHMGGSFYDEFIITAPDDTEAVISDNRWRRRERMPLETTRAGYASSAR